MAADSKHSDNTLCGSVDTENTQESQDSYGHQSHAEYQHQDPQQDSDHSDNTVCGSVDTENTQESRVDSENTQDIYGHHSTAEQLSNADSN